MADRKDTEMTWHSRALGLAALVAAIVVLSCCTPLAARTSSAPTPQTPAKDGEKPPLPAPTPTALLVGPASPCGLPPIVVPTPAADPGYTELDPSTGLHVTGQMQLLDPASYRLRVTGMVDRPLELTYDEIRCLPKVEASPDLVCPGFFLDRATWAGTPIADILALAQVQKGADTVWFFGADGYSKPLSLARVLDRANFLAYEWEGQPLPRLHGFPVRVVIPEGPGNEWTKWLVEIKVQ
jgi:DMSO/TMAO reductase YedYZ molybdopterin-dependent catalytic subunit